MIYIQGTPFHFGHVNNKTIIPDEVRSFVFSCKHDEELKVQADGHELEYIREIMVNIPMTNKRVVRWDKPFSSFICNNL